MESLTADPVKIWTFVIVGLSFALYIGIAWRAKAETTSDFYVAGSQVGAVANGMTESIECQAQPLQKMVCQDI